MPLEISKRQWEQVLERLSKLESSVKRIEAKFEVLEKRLKPAEIYRVVKQQEQEETIAAELKHKMP